MRMTLHLRDLGGPLIDAWRHEFADIASVTISEGDFFSTKDGPIAASDPIDVRADAVISPANSFGFMDGGVDAVYTYQLGPQVQEQLQARLAELHDGELPIGQAIIVPTGRAEIPWCISAPTMRTPGFVGDSLNAYLAFRAALLAVREHNRGRDRPIRSILCPGWPPPSAACPSVAARDRCVSPGSACSAASRSRRARWPKRRATKRSSCVDLRERSPSRGARYDWRTTGSRKRKRSSCASCA